MKTKNKAQTALEFLLLLAGVIIISVIVISALGLQTNSTKEATGKKSTEFLDVIAKGTEPGGQFKPIECAITANPIQPSGGYVSDTPIPISFSVKTNTGAIPASAIKIKWEKFEAIGNFEPTDPTTATATFKTAAVTGTVIGTIKASFVENEKNYSCSKSVMLKIPTQALLTGCEFPLPLSNKTITSGGTQQYRLNEYYSDGINPVYTTGAIFNWSVDASIGNMDTTQKNLFKAITITDSTSKTGIIRATDPITGTNCSTQITVSPTLLFSPATCNILPAENNVETSATKQFSLQIVKDGVLQDADQSLTTWSAEGGIGTINSTGLLTATSISGTSGQVIGTYAKGTQGELSCAKPIIITQALGTITGCEIQSTLNPTANPIEAKPEEATNISLIDVYSSGIKQTSIPTSDTATFFSATSTGSLGTFSIVNNSIVFTPIAASSIISGTINYSKNGISCSKNLKINPSAIVPSTACETPKCITKEKKCVDPLQFEFRPEGTIAEHGTCYETEMKYENISPLCETKLFCETPERKEKVYTYDIGGSSASKRFTYLVCNEFGRAETVCGKEKTLVGNRATGTILKEMPEKKISFLETKKDSALFMEPISANDYLMDDMISKAWRPYDWQVAEFQWAYSAGFGIDSPNPLYDIGVVDFSSKLISPGYNKIEITPTSQSVKLVQVQWGYAEKEMYDMTSATNPVSDGGYYSPTSTAILSKTELNKKGIFSACDSGACNKKISITHKGEAHCMDIYTGTEYPDCLIYESVYSYRIRGLDNSLTPTTPWKYYYHKVNYPDAFDVNTPYIERSRQIPVDKVGIIGCAVGAEYRWTYPNVEQMLLLYPESKPIGLINKINWRFKENQISLPGSRNCNWFKNVAGGNVRGELDDAKWFKGNDSNPVIDRLGCSNWNQLKDNCGRCVDESRSYWFRVQYSNDGVEWLDVPGGIVYGKYDPEIDTSDVKRVRIDDDKIIWQFRTDKIEWNTIRRPTTNGDAPDKHKGSMSVIDYATDLYYNPDKLYEYQKKDDRIIHYYEDIGDGKVLDKTFFVTHIGDQYCALAAPTGQTTKSAFNCLPDGIYTYRVRAESEFEYPYSDWAYSDYVVVSKENFNALRTGNDLISPNNAELSDIYASANINFPNTGDSLEGSLGSISGQLLAAFHDTKKKFKGEPNAVPPIEPLYTKEEPADGKCVNTIGDKLMTAIDVVVISASMYFAPGSGPGIMGLLNTALQTTATIAASDLGSRTGNMACGSTCAFIFSEISTLGVGAAFNIVAEGSQFTASAFGKAVATEAKDAMINGTFGYLTKKAICDKYFTDSGDNKLCSISMTFAVASLSSYNGKTGNIKKDVLNATIAGLKQTAPGAGAVLACDKMGMGYTEGIKGTICNQALTIAFDQLGAKIERHLNKQKVEEVIIEEPVQEPQEEYGPPVPPQTELLVLEVQNVDGSTTLYQLSATPEELSKDLLLIQNPATGYSTMLKRYDADGDGIIDAYSFQVLQNDPTGVPINNDRAMYARFKTDRLYANLNQTTATTDRLFHVVTHGQTYSEAEEYLKTKPEWNALFQSNPEKFKTAVQKKYFKLEKQFEVIADAENATRTGKTQQDFLKDLKRYEPRSARLATTQSTRPTITQAIINAMYNNTTMPSIVDRIRAATQAIIDSDSSLPKN